MREILVTKEYAGGRMDKLLFRFLDQAPTGFVYKMLRKKSIVLNGKKAKGSEILKENDRIRLYLADETIAKFQGNAAASHKEPARSKGEGSPAFEAALQAFPEQIVFEDDNLLAVNKPFGLLSQKAKPSDLSLNDLVCAYLANGALSEDPNAALFTPGISNRLDRNTSGLVLAGKNPASSRELNRAIREHGPDKFYLCLVKGRIEQAQTLDGYLVKNEATNTVRVRKAGDDGTVPNGARIQTAYQPLFFGKDLTLLSVKLITGKSHQIRAHLSSVGHPVIGDPKYGDRSLNLRYRETYGLSGQLLHAYRMVFHGMKEPLAYLNETVIEAEPPALFTRILRAELPEGLAKIQ